MIIFTVLGLLIFWCWCWCWCFQLGYWLIPAVQTAYVLVLAYFAERRVHEFVVHLGAFAAMVPAAVSGKTDEGGQQT